MTPIRCVFPVVLTLLLGSCVPGVKDRAGAPLAQDNARTSTTETVAKGSGSFTWTTVAPAPVTRYEGPGVAANGKLYVFGGYTDRLATMARTDIYDAATDTWSLGPDMPQALTHTPTVVDGRMLWLVGGFLGDSPGPAVANVWKYDTLANTWSAGPSLPAPRAAGGAAIVGRELHFFGGATRPAGTRENSDEADHWVLDLEGGTSWQSRAPLPNPRNHLAGAALGGKVYAIGGQHGRDEAAGNQSEVDVYDPSTDTWARAADLPRPLGHITNSTFEHNGRIVVVGGVTQGGTEVADVNEYDPAANVWLSLTSLPAPRQSPIAGAIGGRLFSTTGAAKGLFPMTWASTDVNHAAPPVQTRPDGSEARTPPAGASVEVTEAPPHGPGQVGEHVLAGVVPHGATRAIVGLRVNTECDCAGASDFTLHESRYAEGDGTANQVPNPDFSREWEGWGGLQGTGTARIESGDQGGGAGLHVTAQPDESLLLNSAAFPVTPGATYRAVFRARVAPASVGSGYFAVIFLGPSELQRERLPLKPAIQTMPDGNYLYVVPNYGIEVYDIDDHHRHVKTISLPQLENNDVRGVAASAATTKLYISYNSAVSGQGEMLAFDLVTENVLWTERYPPSVDSMCITPDGKTIYLPPRESRVGDSWTVVDAATGNIITKIVVGPGPHNTLCSQDGTKAYMAATHYNYLTIVDTSTNQITRKIGPFCEGIRPITVNGTNTLAFVIVNELLGFEVGDIRTGRRLYRIEVPGFPDKGREVDDSTSSHGIGLRPDEQEVWVVDSDYNYVHVFDVTGLPSVAPVKIGQIPTSRPKWLSFSLDGRFVYVTAEGTSSPAVEVMDAATKQLLTRLTLPDLATRKYLEIDFVGGKPIRAGSRHGVGHVTDHAPALPDPALVPAPCPSG